MFYPPSRSSSFEAISLPPSFAGAQLPRVNLGIGAVHIALDPAVVWTVLGSCVAVILFAPAMRTSAICHAQLPTPLHGDGKCREACPHPCMRRGTPASELKYVTCCVDHMVSQLEKHGASRSGLSCAIIGGADLFKIGHGPSIGQSNIETAQRVLKGLRIPVQFEDVGGQRGRTVTYDTATGKILLHRTRKANSP